jgi:bifunctional DNA-binding transcriptional regulator/antitoxin component of YhaV-PrlF toxin-antitoxin module
MTNKRCEASITAKNQTTVPKQVREYLNVSSYDSIIYEIDDTTGKVFVYKKEKVCPLCEGEKDIYGYKCIACNGTGTENLSVNIYEYIITLNCSSKSNPLEIDVKIRDERAFPIVILRSDVYPEEVLMLIQDYLQYKIIENELNKIEVDNVKNILEGDRYRKAENALLSIMSLYFFTEKWQRNFMDMGYDIIPKFEKI